MDNDLQQGIMAAKAGDKHRAFDLLTRAADDPATSEQAWLWLSGVVNDDPERLYCLNNVLRINPNNDAAKRGAAMLRQKGVFPSIPVYPESQRAAPVQDTSRQSPSSKSSQVNSAAPVRTQTVAAPVTPSRPQQQPSYETDWKKQELLGFFQYAAEQLALKNSQKNVEKLLINRGASPEIAKTIVKDAQDAVRKMRREKYKKQMLRGLAWTIVGSMITCGTYVFADSLGGKFVLLYGAIIFGIIDFIAGLFGWIYNL
ncbi:MAG TPA: hypothetical protein VFQ13_20690 [Anaerolineales bacterium]|nr:hypothetical protein [Anaerolineales bacterium]